MRDERGIYLGTETCKHWRGISHFQNIVCCGGRVTKTAFVRCDKKGAVRAEPVCVEKRCKEIQLFSQE